MLKKIAKRGGIVMGILVLLLGSGVLYSSWHTHRLFTKTYDIKIVDLDIPMDSISIQAGEHIAHIRGCVECHGADLSGKEFANDGFFGRLIADNLTSGKGGIGSQYTTKDWIRAIRHGVRPNGKPVIFMPSHEFNVLSKTDLENLIAYLQQIPPVDKTHPENAINIPVRVMYTMTGAPHLFPVELIDHSQPLIQDIDKTDPVKYGEYLSTTCMGCHRADFTGGTIAGVPPEWPEATDITGNSYFATHGYDDFKQVMRTGINAEGRQLNGTYMPWPVFKHLTDEELTALYAFLNTK
ncbi:MAG: cytochrome c4 [Bacteroidota bacterium]